MSYALTTNGKKVKRSMLLLCENCLAGLINGYLAKLASILLIANGLVKHDRDS